MEGYRHSVTSADGTLAVLDGQGHEAIESAPGQLASQLAGFFGY